MHHVAVLFQESENEPIYWTDGSHSDCAPLENIMGLLERKGYVPAHEEILPSGHVLHYAGDNITRQQEPLKELFI